MKKKIVEFRKLKFSKSNVASLNAAKILGGATEFPECKASDPVTCTPVCCMSEKEYSCEKDPVDTGNTLTN